MSREDVRLSQCDKVVRGTRHYDLETSEALDIIALDIIEPDIIELDPVELRMTRLNVLRNTARNYETSTGSERTT